MITGKENILHYYDSSGRKMWKLHYKGGAQFAEGIDENEANNRAGLEDILNRINPGKYLLQTMPDLSPANTSRHLKLEINTGENSTIQPYGQERNGVYGIGQVEQMVEQRIGQVLSDKIAIMEQKHEIQSLKNQLKAKDGLGDISPWQKFWMESIGAIIPTVAPMAVSYLGNQPPAIAAPPKTQPKAQPKTESTTAEIEAFNAEAERQRNRLLAIVDKMQTASPQKWLDSLEKVADKYSENPQKMEQMLPMLDQL